MTEKINQLIDSLSDYLANHKGLLPFMGIILIITNWIFQFIPSMGWIGNTNFLLHFGIVLAIVGFLIAWAL